MPFKYPIQNTIFPFFQNWFSLTYFIISENVVFLSHSVDLKYLLDFFLIPYQKLISRNPFPHYSGHLKGKHPNSPLTTSLFSEHHYQLYHTSLESAHLPQRLHTKLKYKCQELLKIFKNGMVHVKLL